MAVLVALYEVKNKVPNIEGSVPHLSVVVPPQRLLVLGRVEEGNIARFIELIHGVLEGCLGSLFVVRPDPRRSIIEVSWKDSLETVDHEEWRVVGGPTRGRP